MLYTIFLYVSQSIHLFIISLFFMWLQLKLIVLVHVYVHVWGRL